MMQMGRQYNQEHRIAEIQLTPFNGTLLFLNKRNDGSRPNSSDNNSPADADNPRGKRARRRYPVLSCRSHKATHWTGDSTAARAGSRQPGAAEQRTSISSIPEKGLQRIHKRNEGFTGRRSRSMRAAGVAGRVPCCRSCVGELDEAS
jgi:hypothetical protein